MTLLPQGLKVHLAFGYTDMRIDGLAMLQKTAASGSMTPTTSKRSPSPTVALNASRS